MRNLLVRLTMAPARGGRRACSARHRGLTVIELLVVVAVLVVLLAIAAPSMSELVVRQRVKSINAELVTDLQFARSTAVSRNTDVVVKFMQNASMSCYVVYLATFNGDCDCTLPPGSNCSPPPSMNGPEEIRSTQVPASTGVALTTSSTGFLIFGSDGLRNGANVDYVVSTARVGGAAGQLRVKVNATGRPTVCTPDASITGVTPCSP